LLEVWSNSDDFVDQVLNADDSVLAQNLFDNFVCGKWDSLLINFSVSSLVDQVRDNLSGWVAEGDERLDLLEHVEGGSVDSDEDGVVELSKSEQLEDLSDLRSVIVDTSNSDHKGDFSFSWDKERVFRPGLSSFGDQALFLFLVGLVVLFTSLLVFSLSGSESFGSLGEESLSAFG